MAAVDGQEDARHPGRGVGREEEEGGVEILRSAEPSHRDALDHGLAGGGGEEVGIDVGLDIARRERVDADAVARPFERERRVHLPDRRLRDGIGRDAARHAQAEDRGDVDDAPAPSRRPPAPRRLDREQEGAAQIGRHHRVEIGDVRVEGGRGRADPGIVDEDVGLLGERRDEGRDRVRVGDVERMGAGRGGAGAAQILGERLEPVDAAGGEDDMGAVARAQSGEMGAEPGGGAGDDDVPSGDPRAEIHERPSLPAHRRVRIAEGRLNVRAPSVKPKARKRSSGCRRRRWGRARQLTNSSSPGSFAIGTPGMPSR